MSSPADSFSQPDLPVNTTCMDFIERYQLPPDLHQEGHFVTSFFEAAEYRSRLTSRLGAPPRTPNGSHLDSLSDFPSLLSSWTSVGSVAPTSGASPLGGATSSLVGHTRSVTRSGRVDALRADVAAGSGRVDALRADVAARGDHVDALRADVVARGDHVDALRADVVARGGRVDALRADAEAYRPRLRQAESRFRELGTTNNIGGFV